MIRRLAKKVSDGYKNHQLQQFPLVFDTHVPKCLRGMYHIIWIIWQVSVAAFHTLYESLSCGFK